MGKLKKCPFCGGEAQLKISLKDGAVWYECEKCGTKGGGFWITKNNLEECIEKRYIDQAEEIARENWNRRDGEGCRPRNLIDKENLKEEIESLQMTITGLGIWKGAAKNAMKEYQKSVLRIIEEKAVNEGGIWRFPHNPPEVGEPVLLKIRHTEWISNYDDDFVPENEKVYHPESRDVYRGEYKGQGIWKFFDQDGAVHCDAEENVEISKGILRDVVEGWMPVRNLMEEL